MKTTLSIFGLLLLHFQLLAAPKPPILRNVLTTNAVTLGSTMSLSVGNVLDSTATGGAGNTFESTQFDVTGTNVYFKNGAVATNLITKGHTGTTSVLTNSLRLSPGTNTFVVDPLIIGTGADQNSRVSIFGDVSAETSTSAEGLSIVLTSPTTKTGGGGYNAISAQAQGTYTGLGDSFGGVIGQATLFGTGGSVPNLIGTQGIVGIGSGNGVVTRGMALWTDISANSGTMLNAHGVHVELGVNGAGVGDYAGYYFAPIQITSGSLTNAYGILIADVTQASTLNYAIKSGLGKVQFGDLTTVSNADFAVTGKASIGGRLENLGVIGSGSALVTFQASDAVASDNILVLAANAITGTMRVINESVSATVGIYNHLQNSGAGYALSLIQAGSAGDAYTRYATTHSDWAVGGDDSDGGKYKVSLGGVLGTGDKFTMDTNGVSTFSGSMIMNSVLGAQTAALNLTPTDLVTTDNVLVLSGNAITGTINVVNESVSATVGIYNKIQNGGAGYALNLIQAGTTGDAYQRFVTSSGADWAEGCDFSDATKFKVSFGGTLGTADRFTLTTNGNATISGSLSIGGGAAMLKTLTATAVLDFPSTLTLTDSDLTIAVTGAALGDVVNLGVPHGSTLSGGCFTAWVSSADTVTVRFSCYSATSKDPASGTFRVQVNQF